MINASRHMRLTLLFAASVAVSFGLGTLFPTLDALGSKSNDGKKIAMVGTNACTSEASDVSDDIYFLSCGGIY